MPNRIYSLLYLSAFAVGVGCLLGMAMSGCAVIEQTHADGTVARSFTFGAPVIMAADPNSQANVIKATGLGLILSDSVTTLGWFDQSRVALDRDCRIVLVGNTDAQLSRFGEFLHNTTDLCGGSIHNGDKQ
jgi:hypothetical protein